MNVKCNIDKCPFRYEKPTACNYYWGGVCEIMSDEEEDYSPCSLCEHHECFDCPEALPVEDF